MNNLENPLLHRLKCFMKHQKANYPIMLKILGWAQISNSINCSSLPTLQITLHFHSKQYSKKNAISHLVSMFIKCVDALSAAQFPYSHALVRTARNKMLIVWRKGDTKDPGSMAGQSACNICMLPETHQYVIRKIKQHSCKIIRLETKLYCTCIH